MDKKRVCIVSELCLTVIQTQIAFLIVNKGTLSGFSMWTHPAQCPLCGPQRVQCSQNRSFLSSTETGQH